MMQFRINLCEKHYGVVNIKADYAADALASVNDAIVNGDVIWTQTELVNKSIEEILHLSTCCHCNHEFVMQQADCKDDEWYTTCPICHREYIYQIPNDSPVLRFIFGYCRVRQIYQDKGYLSLKYYCDPNAEPGAPLDSMDSCMCCPREGCHLHTAAMDGEMLLNGEKDLETVDSFWKDQVYE